MANVTLAGTHNAFAVWKPAPSQITMVTCFLILNQDDLVATQVLEQPD